MTSEVSKARSEKVTVTFTSLSGTLALREASCNVRDGHAGGATVGALLDSSSRPLSQRLLSGAALP